MIKIQVLTRTEIEDFFVTVIGLDCEDAAVHAHGMTDESPHYGYAAPTGEHYYVTWDEATGLYTVEELLEVEREKPFRGMNIFSCLRPEQGEWFIVGGQLFEIFPNRRKATQHVITLQHDEMHLCPWG